MKKLHFALPYQSHAMLLMVNPLLDGLKTLYDVTVSEKPDDSADVNIHFPFHTLIGYGTAKDSRHVMLYTHCNANAQAQLLDACERADLIICMAFAGRVELIELGVSPEKLWVIPIPLTQPIPLKRRVVGIVGFPQPNGRKREHILLDLAWTKDLSLFEFLFVGVGWDDIVNKLNIVGVPAQAVQVEDIGTAYHAMDVLLVTGYTEGGSLPILEAMSAGVKVLSPRYGYAKDYLSDDNYYDSVDDLYYKLSSLSHPLIENHLLANAWKSRDYVAEYALVIGRLLNESVDVFPEMGMSRYNQLLDIIDEYKPASICEIGTWSGTRAIQMIQQAAKYSDMADVEYTGYDLFDDQTKAQVTKELSKNAWREDVVYRKLLATTAFIMLHKGKTSKTLQNVESHDLYFIDGGHSEATIKSDADFVLASMPDNAVVIFDDYYTEPVKEFGCNKYIKSLESAKYNVEILPVVTQADDGRGIAMVKVTKKNADLHLQRQETSSANITWYFRESEHSL